MYIRNHQCITVIFYFFSRVLKVGQDCYGALWKMNDDSTQFLSLKANSAITWTFILQLVVIIRTKVFQIWQLSIPSCLWFVVKCPSNTSWGQNDILKKFLKSCCKIKICLLSHNFQEKLSIRYQVVWSNIILSPKFGHNCSSDHALSNKIKNSKHKYIRLIPNMIISPMFCFHFLLGISPSLCNTS